MPVNPLLKGDQSARPSQPVTPLSAGELARCSQDVLLPWIAQHDGRSTIRHSPVLLTYLTDVPARAWPLGLSASLHGVPLVIAGRGMRWQLETKLDGVSRALQLLQATAPERPVLFADGTDTVMARAAVADTHGATLRQLARSSRRVLLSAECNSWPRCYTSNYSGHAAHAACRANRHPTCFPNSGAYLGSSTAMLRLLPELVRASAPGFGGIGEAGDDQAAVHHAFLGRVASDLELEIDSHSKLLLNLGACKGSGRPRAFLGSTQLCHYGAYDPLKQLERSKEPPALGGTAAALPALRVNDVSAGVQQPLLVHANGIHDRMARAWFGRLQGTGASLVPTLSPAQARNLTELWRAALLPDPDRQLQHPILLIDSAQGGVCNVTTLGSLLDSFLDLKAG